MVDIFGSNVIIFEVLGAIMMIMPVSQIFVNFLPILRRLYIIIFFLASFSSIFVWGPKAIREDVPRVPTAIFAVGQVYPGGLTLRQPH